MEAVVLRVVGSRRIGLDVDLGDRVRVAVDRHVEAHAEQMLVVRGRHLGGDEVGVADVGRARPRWHRHRLDDAGELDLELDGAVEVEVPVEGVLVVAHRVDRADHQPALPAHLGAERVQVLVLPEDREVLLVHADGVLDHLRPALLVGQDGVEVVDLAQAVTAQRQRVDHATEAPLAGVEGVLPPLRRRGVAVRDDHLRQRGTVQHRARLAAARRIGVGQVVEDEPLDLVHRHADLPPLPMHQVALDAEGGTVGLGDVDRPQIVP